MHDSSDQPPEPPSIGEFLSENGSAVAVVVLGLTLIILGVTFPPLGVLLASIFAVLGSSRSRHTRNIDENDPWLAILPGAAMVLYGVFALIRAWRKSRQRY